MSIKEQLKDKGFEIHGLKGLIKNGSVMDADTGVPTAITAANVGVPAELLTFFSEKVVKVLTAPRNATKLFPEVVQGDWGTERIKFRIAESVGNVAPYSDFSEIGVSDINNEWVPQDVFLIQTMIKYGDLEAARNALAKVNLVEGKQTAAANTLGIYLNRYYMYGVRGLNIFGIMNHPLLPSALTPATVGEKTAWADKGADAIYDDINSIMTDLFDKSQGLIDSNVAGKLAVSPKLNGALSKRNTYGLSVLDMVKKSFPNLELVIIPEFATASGDYVYIIANEVLGQSVGECVTNMKLRTFQLIPEASSFKQKVAAGTAGFRLLQPFAISRMLVS